MSHHVSQENRVSSHLLSSISFITIPQTPLVNSDYHRKLHKPVGFAYSSLFLPHPSLRRRNLQNLRVSLSLGYLGNPFWRPRRPTNVIVAQTPQRPVCPPSGGVQERGAWPVKLVEPSAGQEWLWPDGTRDSLHPLLPFCWDAVPKPQFACVVWGYWTL